MVGTKNYSVTQQNYGVRQSKFGQLWSAAVQKVGIVVFECKPRRSSSVTLFSLNRGWGTHTYIHTVSRAEKNELRDWGAWQQ